LSSTCSKNKAATTHQKRSRSAAKQRQRAAVCGCVGGRVGWAGG
jgi:hypothetical protein